MANTTTSTTSTGSGLQYRLSNNPNDYCYSPNDYIQNIKKGFTMEDINDSILRNVTKGKLNMELDVVDNGYIAKIGKRIFIFETLDKLNEWFDENFKSPECAKRVIKKIKA